MNKSYILHSFGLLIAFGITVFSGLSYLKASERFDLAHSDCVTHLSPGQSSSRECFSGHLLQSRLELSPSQQQVVDAALAKEDAHPLYALPWVFLIVFATSWFHLWFNVIPAAWSFLLRRAGELGAAFSGRAVA